MVRSRWFGWKRNTFAPSKSRPGLFRPQLESLEQRCLLSAVEILPGFSANTLGNTDDGVTGPIPLGFSAQFSTQNFSDVFVNNNGNVTVGSSNSNPFAVDFNTTTRTIFAPFMADVDTRATSAVTFGTDTLNGHNAFAVNWPDVGYYQRHTDRLNNFQVVFIDRSDTGAGNFDVEFNYDRIEWETGDADGGEGGLGGSSPAVAGFSAGTQQTGTSYTLAGSGMAGSFLDGNTTLGLIHNSLNSDVPGRFLFSFRNGVLLNNQAPTADAGGPYTVAEGGSLPLNGLASSDPDGDPQTFSWDVNGDGTFGDAAGGNPTLTWAQLQSLGINDGPSSFVVRVQVDDGQGHVATSAATTLSVTNTAPTLTLSGAATTAETATYTLSLSSSDPGQDTIQSWTINWGDGPAQSVSGNPGSVTHVYADGPNDFTISAMASDEDGMWDAGNSIAVHVNNVAPTLALSGGAAVNEGSSYTLGLAARGSGPDTIVHWTITWGDGAVQTVNGNPSATTHIYADGSNDYSITATATDEDGTWNAGNAIAVHVNNVAPTLSISGSAAVVAGSTYTLNLAASDPGQDTIAHWTITWGDGNTQTVTGNPGSATHVYASGPNDYTISATATDEDGTWNAGNSVSVHVNATTSTNAPPIVTGLTSNALHVGDAAVGTNVKISATFTDADAADTHTAVISWGDGSTSAGVIQRKGTGWTVTGKHSYATGGFYAIRLTVTDNHQGSDTENTSALITGAGIQGGVLYIIGTSYGDYVDVRLPHNGQLKVQAGFLSGNHTRTFSTAGIDRIVIELGNGDDVAAIEHTVKVAAILDGGNGDDCLSAGGGPTILLGGTGNDILFGGPGRDILIGGRGHDLLYGGSDQNILIGGATDFDANDAALWAVLQEWNSSRSLAARMANLKGTGTGIDFTNRLNGNTFLKAGNTVHDDGAADLLLARHGDWVFANHKDWIF